MGTTAPIGEDALRKHGIWILITEIASLSGWIYRSGTKNVDAENALDAYF
jgi:hypothetical protein